jgi:hypothetical protein
MDLDDHEISQELDLRLGRVMYDRRRRAEVFLTALIRNHIGRIMFLVSHLPKIEDALLDPERIRSAKTSDLTRLLMAMSQGIESSSEFLRSFVSDADLRSDPLTPSGRLGFALPDPSDDGEGEEAVEETNLSEERIVAQSMTAESRQRLGSIFRRVLTVVGVGKLEEVKEVSVDQSDGGGAKPVKPKKEAQPKQKRKAARKSKKSKKRKVCDG